MRVKSILRRLSDVTVRPALGALQDHPHLVNTGLVLLTVIFTQFLRHRWKSEPFEVFKDHGLDLALGMLSLAGIMAGFIGVVVVFGLQASAPVFVRFRVVSGRSLGRNWLVLIATGFLSAGAAMAAAVAYVLGSLVIAFGALLLSVLLSIHAAMRMLWLVRLLIVAVRIDDKEKLNPSKPAPAATRYTPA